MDAEGPDRYRDGALGHGSAKPLLVIAMTGSIAIAVMPGVIFGLSKIFPHVGQRIVCSGMAASMVPRSTFASYCRTDVYGGWDDLRAAGLSHVDLVADATVLLVCPATANFIGKAAGGIADDVIPTAFMAAPCPKIVVPSMNREMFESPAVQRNLEILRNDGVEVITPVAGPSAASGMIETGSIPPVRELSLTLARHFGVPAEAAR